MVLMMMMLISLFFTPHAPRRTITQSMIGFMIGFPSREQSMIGECLMMTRRHQESVCIVPASVAPVGECVVFLALRLVSLRFVLFRFGSSCFVARPSREVHTGVHESTPCQNLPGLELLVSGVWSLVSGLWSLVSGLWSLVSNSSPASCSSYFFQTFVSSYIVPGLLSLS